MAYSHCCNMMKTNIDSEEIPINFIAKFREYGIRVLDSGTSQIVIEFCPWCGSKLPPNLRDRWHDELEKIGINPDDSETSIPEQFHDERWFLEKTI